MDTGGRKKAVNLVPYQRRQVKRLLRKGVLSIQEIASKYGVAKATISRIRRHTRGVPSRISEHGQQAILKAKPVYKQASLHFVRPAPLGFDSQTVQ